MRASAAIRASSVVGGGAHEANRRRLGASDAGGRYPVPSRTAVAMSASSTSDTAAAAAASSAAKDAAAKEASDWTSLRRASGVNLAVGHPGRLPDRVLARAMESAAAKLRGDALASDLGFRPADDDLARLGAPPLSYVARRAPGGARRRLSVPLGGLRLRQLRPTREIRRARRQSNDHQRRQSRIGPRVCGAHSTR